jgi:hypothetical protein
LKKGIVEDAEDLAVLAFHQEAPPTLAKSGQVNIVNTANLVDDLLDAWQRTQKGGSSAPSVDYKDLSRLDFREDFD